MVISRIRGPRTCYKHFNLDLSQAIESPMFTEPSSNVMLDNDTYYIPKPSQAAWNAVGRYWCTCLLYLLRYHLESSYQDKQQRQQSPAMQQYHNCRTYRLYPCVLPQYETYANGRHKHPWHVTHLESIFVNSGKYWTHLELLLDKVRELFIGNYCIHLI